MRLSLVCVLFDPAIPTSFFNFIQLFLYLFLFFFIALSVIYQCHLASQLLIKRKMGYVQNSLPRPSLTCVPIIMTMNRMMKRMKKAALGGPSSDDTFLLREKTVLLLAAASYPAYFYDLYV